MCFEEDSFQDRSYLANANSNWMRTRKHWLPTHRHLSCLRTMLVGSLCMRMTLIAVESIIDFLNWELARTQTKVTNMFPLKFSRTLSKCLHIFLISNSTPFGIDEPKVDSLTPPPLRPLPCCGFSTFVNFSFCSFQFCYFNT